MCCKPLRPLLAHVSLTRIDIPVRSSVGSEPACGRHRPASGSCCGQECPRAGGGVRMRQLATPGADSATVLRAVQRATDNALRLADNGFEMLLVAEALRIHLV